MCLLGISRASIESLIAVDSKSELRILQGYLPLWDAACSIQSRQYDPVPHKKYAMLKVFSQGWVRKCRMPRAPAQTEPHFSAGPGADPVTTAKADANVVIVRYDSGECRSIGSPGSVLAGMNLSATAGWLSDSTRLSICRAPWCSCHSALISSAGSSRKSRNNPWGLKSSESVSGSFRSRPKTLERFPPADILGVVPVLGLEPILTVEHSGRLQPLHRPLGSAEVDDRGGQRAKEQHALARPRIKIKYVAANESAHAMLFTMSHLGR